MQILEIPPHTTTQPIHHPERMGETDVEHAFRRDVVDTKAALSLATEREEGHRLIDVDSQGSTENLRTMGRAVSLFGPEVSEEFKIEPRKVTIATRQLDALLRKKGFAFQALGSLSYEEALHLEHVNEPDPGQVVSAGGQVATSELVDGTVGVTSSPGVSLTYSWRDFQVSKENQFASEVVDDSAHIIIALCLAKMEKIAPDEIERKAAVIALDKMRRIMDSPDIDIIAEPENTRTVRIAGMLGHWASELAANAVVKHHVASNL